MKSSIATVSLAGQFADKVRVIAAAGFDGIEIFEQDFLASDLSPREVGQIARDEGLEITLFQPFRDFEGLPEPLRRRTFAQAERKLALTAELGAKQLLVISTVHPAALGGIDRMADDFRELGDVAAQHGVRVGLSALSWGRYLRDHRDAWEVVRRADHPRVGLVLNSFHSLVTGADLDPIRAIPGDRIFHVQLADAPATVMDPAYLSRHFRVMPGEGELDVTGFMAAVQATGYDGPISLEIYNDELRAGLPRLVAQDGYRSLLTLLDRVRRAEPDARISLPDFPPPATVEGFGFIEFASSPDEAPALEALLQSAGFAPAGKHVSKPVTLWRQGGANLLVNTDQSGFAHTSYVVHGTTVSEVGLLVPDAAATHARALALRVQDHHPAGKKGELDIPAIRGVSGSVLRLLDHGPELGRIWEVDFRVSDDVEGAGITGIDHIGQTMAHQDIMSSGLLYTALFEVDKSPLVDVMDPDGVVQSQAVQSGGLRVTLNGSEARRTLAGSFVEESFGASVQHIAFATDDIFATASALASRGFPVLQIGPNYYADVEARFGLDPDLTARLKAANIFYDEDEWGQFLHFYSTPWQKGFFFEVVERRGGYRGYGGPNAPFRLAAQKRFARPAGLPLF